MAETAVTFDDIGYGSLKVDGKKDPLELGCSHRHVQSGFFLFSSFQCLVEFTHQMNNLKRVWTYRLFAEVNSSCQSVWIDQVTSAKADYGELDSSGKKKDNDFQKQKFS